MNESKIKFLSRVTPFNKLSREKLEKAAAQLSKTHHFRDMTLFVQGKTILNHIYILLEGRLEQYILENQEKIMRSFLEENDIYGGLSILFNQGISIRTVHSLEDVTFYRLPKEHFLALCSEEVEFTKHFTESFSQKMTQKSYIANIARLSCADSGETDGLTGSFFYQNLSNVYSKDVLICKDDCTVQEAAKTMTEQDKSSLVVQDQNNQNLGLLTDHDIREKVIAPGRPLDTPVREFVSSPLISTPVNTQAFEAILLMMQHNIKHVAVTGPGNELLGIATDQDFLLAQGQSPVFFMHELHKADSVEKLKSRFQQLPSTIKYLIEGGARAEHLNSIITAVSDLILQKAAGFAQKEVESAPVDYAFIVLGSEGRKEQTLKTDQDNAIIFEDVEDKDFEEVQKYFLKLGEKISFYLNEIGFTYCEYEIMAQNPRWCQPLAQWKKYFLQWIRTAEPEALLQASIFFDFRRGFGSRSLVQELRQHLFDSLGGWKGFFRHLAENALYFKPPLDFFGNFALLSKGDQKNKLDIKSPMRLIVDFARIYALQNKLPQTNTLERLEEIYLTNTLEKQDYEELVHAYSYMMNMRLNHQVGNIIEKQVPADNYLNPKEFTHIEQQALKEAFKRIRMAQGKMRMELTYDTGIT